MPSTALLAADPPAILHRLERLCRGEELGPLAARLAHLAHLVAPDLARLEGALQITPGERAVEQGAAHLLATGGKRLRPVCVSLAARLGTGFDERALQLALAAELVHAATLLHDDVVDLADRRRGAPAARALLGNAVSIFAGDWLLVDALRRVSNVDLPGLLPALLDCIETMIVAESLQLERRGSLETTAAEWFEIVDGKTAALFRWAMRAGGQAGGLAEPHCAALERYGRHLGIAFQAVDDMLDLAGDPTKTGKALFTDVAEGMLTYPLIIALEQEPELAEELAAIAAADHATPGAHRSVLRSLERTGGLDATRALAEEHAALATAALLELPEGRARDGLATVADVTVHRPS